MAAEDSLKERELAILDGRFGIFGGEGHTLQAVGKAHDVSRERIRQIVNKSLRKLWSRGRQQVRRGKLNEPCAQLVTYVADTIRPGEAGDTDRLLEIAGQELAHLNLKTQAIPLLAYFLGGKKGIEQYRQLAAERLAVFRRSQWQERQRQQLYTWLQDVIWPPHIRPLDERSWGAFSAQREVSADSRGRTGAFYSHKLKRHIAYESELEWRFLERLEELGEILFYQEQPLQIPYQVKDRPRTYYPDIFFVLNDGRGIVVEIKGISEMALFYNWTKWTALRAYCREQGYGLLVTDGRYSLQAVGRWEVRPAVRLALLDALVHGPLGWPEYKALREQCGITTRELYALVIRGKLRWGLQPFRLEQGSSK